MRDFIFYLGHLNFDRYKILLEDDLEEQLTILNLENYLLIKDPQPSIHQGLLNN